MAAKSQFPCGGAPIRVLDELIYSENIKSLEDTLSDRPRLLVYWPNEGALSQVIPEDHLDYRILQQFRNKYSLERDLGRPDYATHYMVSLQQKYIDVDTESIALAHTVNAIWSTFVSANSLGDVFRFGPISTGLYKGPASYSRAYLTDLNLPPIISLPKYAGKKSEHDSKQTILPWLCIGHELGHIVLGGIPELLGGGRVRPLDTLGSFENSIREALAREVSSGEDAVLVDEIVATVSESVPDIINMLMLGDIGAYGIISFLRGQGLNGKLFPCKQIKSDGELDEHPPSILRAYMAVAATNELKFAPIELYSGEGAPFREDNEMASFLLDGMRLDVNVSVPIVCRKAKRFVQVPVETVMRYAEIAVRAILNTPYLPSYGYTKPLKDYDFAAVRTCSHVAILRAAFFASIEWEPVSKEIQDLEDKGFRPMYVHYAKDTENRPDEHQKIFDEAIAKLARI